MIRGVAPTFAAFNPLSGKSTLASNANVRVTSGDHTLNSSDNGALFVVTNLTHKVLFPSFASGNPFGGAFSCTLVNASGGTGNFAIGTANNATTASASAVGASVKLLVTNNSAGAKAFAIPLSSK